MPKTTQKSDYFNEIGNSLMYLHKYDEAITFFNKSIALDSSCTAYINKCMSLHTLKKYPEVIECFKIAITKCQNDTIYNHILHEMNSYQTISKIHHMIVG